VTAEIRVASSPGEALVAVVVDDALTDFAIWRVGAPDGVGDVHRGRVVTPMPAMAGAFVAIAGAEGFLPDSEGAKGLTAGTMLTVRVTRSAQGGKGPRLSARGIDGGEGMPSVGLLRRGPDPVARFAAMWPGARVLTDDPRLFAALRPVLGARLALERVVLDDMLLGAIESLAEPAVTLPEGARIAIHPTPALTAIDVDAAGMLAGRGGQHLAMNQAVIPHLGRQIRLRNLSGAIRVDFAGMPARRRALLGSALAAALADDPLGPRLLGFTALGLAEIVRTRVHPPLHEVLGGPHAAGLAALRRIAAATAADPAFVPVLRASPFVEAALRADPAALDDLAHRTGRRLIMRADPGLPGTAWTLDDAHG
jgi:hypothetical protein